MEETLILEWDESSENTLAMLMYRFAIVEDSNM